MESEASCLLSWEGGGGRKVTIKVTSPLDSSSQFCCHPALLTIYNNNGKMKDGNRRDYNMRENKDLLDCLTLEWMRENWVKIKLKALPLKRKQGNQTNKTTTYRTELAQQLALSLTWEWTGKETRKIEHQSRVDSFFREKRCGKKLDSKVSKRRQRQRLHDMSVFDTTDRLSKWRDSYRQS